VTDSRRAALVAELVGRLRTHGSWAGETHVQKTTYFLQQLLGVPMGLPFQLYKFGPYSFELRELLGQMRGLHQLELEPQPNPYGPKLTVGPGAPQLQTRFPKTIEKYGAAVDFVASAVGPFGVGSLEHIATALLVQTELPDAGVAEQAARLHAYKPHVSVEQANEALGEVDQLAEKAQQAGVTLAA
jgi:hypothetical protein